MLTSGTYKVWGLEPGEDAPDPSSTPDGVLIIADNHGTSMSRYWVDLSGKLKFPLVQDDSMTYWFRRQTHPAGINHQISSATLDIDNVPPVIHDWNPWRIEIDDAFAGLATTKYNSGTADERIGISDQFSAPLDPAPSKWVALIPQGGQVDNDWLGDEMDQEAPQGWNLLEKKVS